MAEENIQMDTKVDNKDARDTRDNRMEGREGDTRERRPFRRFGDEEGDRRGKVFFRKKVCKFCNNKAKISYKEPDQLKRFITERGKILPRRITGTCARHQRELSAAIRRARMISLLPFVVE